MKPKETREVDDGIEEEDDDDDEKKVGSAKNIDILGPNNATIEKSERSSHSNSNI